MGRTVVLTVEIKSGIHGDFITGKPVVVDARPEPWLWSVWRKMVGIRAPATDPLPTSRIGILAGPATFALLTGGREAAGAVDVIPMRAAEGTREELNVCTTL